MQIREWNMAHGIVDFDSKAPLRRPDGNYYNCSVLWTLAGSGVGQRFPRHQGRLFGAA